MDPVLKMLGRDRFARLAGLTVVEVGPGRAKVEMEAADAHLNGVDMVHGGAIFTLADLAFAAASNSHGTVAVAVNAHISFLKAAGPGRLSAEAEEVSCHARLSSYTIRVRDAEGDLVAIFQGMAYRKRETIEEVLPSA
jgi:acyl-CoA thioesterase